MNADETSLGTREDGPETPDGKVVSLAQFRAARDEGEARAPGTYADLDAVLACLAYLREETTRMEAPATAHFLGAACVALEEEVGARYRG